jgi:hypothetical protein
MRKFAYTAVFATAISAPALAGALLDYSAVSVLGAPPGSAGPCSSSCTVGGANLSNPGQGGHQTRTIPGFATLSESGSGAVPGGQEAGHTTLDVAPTTDFPDGFSGSASGNFTNRMNPKGHCTPTVC